MVRIKDAYFDWLCRRIIRKKDQEELEGFLWELYSIEFRTFVPHDENRAADGLELRNAFLNESTESADLALILGPCTVLEMLVALAERMDFILFDPNKGDRSQEWFWTLINNLKLQKYAVDEQSAARKRRFNRVVIKKLIDRTYLENGEGGLFPLRFTRKDQRKVEIWYQMMDYISENFDI